MRHEVKYKGYTATPSDYDCLEGELAVSQDIIFEDGAMKPIPRPSVVKSFSADRPNGVWVHQTSSFKHYIVSHGYSLHWSEDGEDSGKVYIADIASRVNDVISIGNTLALLCDDGLHYVLWEEQKEGYRYLGNGIPECPISFGLQGNAIYSEDISSLPTDEESATSVLLAKANKMIAEKVVSEGKFIFPFFVRYAYRMYDGRTLTHHSAPILMLPSTTEALVMRGNGTSFGYKIYAIASKLDYLCLASTAELERWKDIITSVDIFISSPIYNYDQNGKVTIGEASKTTDSCFVGRYTGVGGDENYKIINIGDEISGLDSPYFLPKRSYVDIYNDICDCSQFYFLKSIPIESLATEQREVIQVEKDYLHALNVREVMTDDYQSHDKLIAKFAQAYNGRLNVANVKRNLFQGYHPLSMVCYYNSPNATTAKNVNVAVMNTYIPADNGKVKLESKYTNLVNDAVDLACDFQAFSYIYYPDISAYGVSISLSAANGENEQGYSLQPHAMLNGAFVFRGFPTTTRDVENKTHGLDIGINANAKAVRSSGNSLYTSEINNPFYFPLSNIKNIGIGTILGICSASKALSAGQFGQFPLYAFTTEGVWALGVANDGSFVPAQPFTRDVCTNSNSITQLDSSVVFATERGLMLLSGAECLCITDVIDNEASFSAMEALPHLDKVGIDVGEIIPFREYIKNARIVYDYVHQRIIVFANLQYYAYVFSMESKRWGMISANPQLFMPIKSYTEALVMDNNGAILNFSRPDLKDVPQGIIITRPLKLVEADALKQVTSIIQRGVFCNKTISTVLYGSRDMFNWHLVASSTDHYLRGFRGTPYKYFRVVLVGEMLGDESISGCSIDFNLKHVNQMR